MNIADRITEMALHHPSKEAVRYPVLKGLDYEYPSITFAELENRINRFAGGMQKEGLKAGHKVLIFVRPSLNFHALVFAAYKIGLIPIFIDPGMGRKNLLKAIKDVKPEGLIAEPEVHFLKMLFRSSFSSVKYAISTGAFPFWGSGNIHKYLENDYPFESYNWNKDELSSILFTSGGTGKPKGVVYTQEIFQTQTNILQELFNLDLNEVDLPGFPLFSLFTLSMGMTSVIPDMDPSKPSKADPVKLVKNILDNDVTFVAGSPAIWKGVASYCTVNKVTLPSVKYLVMFGAPVSNEMHQQFSQILVNGSTYTPYGATESLPVANISGKEVLQETAKLTDDGKGTCVGKLAPGIEVKIIKETDSPIANLKDATVLGVGSVGEIIVKGKVVTPAYLDLPQENAKAKIKDDNGFWHRIGDMGYLDENHRLWFCGRKAHRVQTKDETLYSVPCEAIFNHHPQVEKTALVGIGEKGNQHPALVVQLKKGMSVDRSQLESELLELGKQHQHTQNITEFTYHDQFPVDVRHNIKIDRKKLAEHATRSLS